LYEASDYGKPAIGAGLKVWMAPRRAKEVEVAINYRDVEGALAVNVHAFDVVVAFEAQIDLDFAAA
jgi:hypothetical protein